MAFFNTLLLSFTAVTDRYRRVSLSTCRGRTGRRRALSAEQCGCLFWWHWKLWCGLMAVSPAGAFLVLWVLVPGPLSILDASPCAVIPTSVAL